MMMMMESIRAGRSLRWQEVILVIIREKGGEKGWS
jgi:hypothetical protein